MFFNSAYNSNFVQNSHDNYNPNSISIIRLAISAILMIALCTVMWFVAAGCSGGNPTGQKVMQAITTPPDNVYYTTTAGNHKLLLELMCEYINADTTLTEAQKQFRIGLVTDQARLDSIYQKYYAPPEVEVVEPVESQDNQDNLPPPNPAE